MNKALENFIAATSTRLAAAIKQYEGVSVEASKIAEAIMAAGKSISKADVNADGKVDEADLSIVHKEYAKKKTVKKTTKKKTIRKKA